MSAPTHPPEQRAYPEPVLEWLSLSQPAVPRRSLAVSVLLHAVGVALLVLLARGGADVRSPGYGDVVRSNTTLVAPPMSLTQSAPNRAKIGKEFSLDSLLTRAALRVPPAIPRFVPKSVPAPPVPEPPKVALGANQQAPPAPQLGSAQLPGPPPQIQLEERPKLGFETPGVPTGKPKPSGVDLELKSPGEVIAEATRAAPRPTGGGLEVSDSDLGPVPGWSRGIQQPPAAGRRATSLELLSDPGGVDFKPYLIRILALVKRNWQSVIPEVARLGRQGRVQVQFIIARDGSVPKLVIAVPSGTDSLDRAAVAGISASTPFPELPPGFNGNEVRLQFTFTYNMR